MQGILYLSQIFQFSSGSFFTNTPMILFPSLKQVALNYGVGLLMKKL